MNLVCVPGSPLWCDAAFGLMPGCAPGRAVTFFCFAKRKSPKKRRPHLAGRPRADCSALLGQDGKSTNSTRVRASNMWTSVSVVSCASRRLRRGPKHVARCASLPYGRCEASRSVSPVCRAGAGVAAAGKRKKLSELRWPQAKRASSFFSADGTPDSVQPAGRDSRVAFLCLLSLAKQRKKARCRGRIPAQAEGRSTRRGESPTAPRTHQP